MTRFSTPRMTPSAVDTYNRSAQVFSCQLDREQPYTYRRGAMFDRFEGVLDLEESTFGRECAGNAQLQLKHISIVLLLDAAI